VARLIRTSEAVWQRPDATADGAVLTFGQKLSLQSGLAEIAFDSGVQVILEGPADFEVGSRKSEVEQEEVRVQGSDENNACVLTLGKIVAHVPKQARGFSVDTPSMRIVDLGTEFGVEVKAESFAPQASGLRPQASPLTQVEVFKGKLAIELPRSKVGVAATAGHLKSKMIGAGQGAVIDSSDTAPRIIKAEPARFVRELPAAPQPGPLATWPQDCPLKPGDIVAVAAKQMQVIKIDPRTGEQELLVQGAAYNGPGYNTGVTWHCVAIAPDGHLLVGVDGLDGLEAGVLRIDPRKSRIEVLARGGLLKSGHVVALAVAEDGTIYGIYQSPPEDKPNHIFKLNARNGAVASLARMEGASGIAMDANGRDFFITSAETGSMAQWQGTILVPFFSRNRHEGCFNAAVGSNGRLFVTSLQRIEMDLREIVEVGRGEGHSQRQVAVLPKAAHSKMPWSIAVEASGNLIAGPAGQDLTVYRVDGKGKVVAVSSGGMLVGRTAVAVVPGVPASSQVPPP
jgi:hypothetical protein